MATRIDVLRILLQASGDGQVKAALAQVGDAADATAGRFARVGTIAGAALGVGVVGAFAAVLRATAESEKVTAQLEARLRSTHQAAGLSKDALLDMAGGLQAVTAFDDEAIVSAENLLLTFTRIHKDVFPQALEAVLDMSTAFDQDLKTSAIQLGKALNDPIQGIAALSRVGVQFTQQQQDTIKYLAETGQVAEAQKVILKELSTEMGGSARAAADTLSGSLHQLAGVAGNLLEGDSGDAGLHGLVGSIHDLTATLNDPAVKQGFQTIVSGMLSVTNATAKAIGAFGGFASIATQKFADAYGLSDGNSYDELLAKRADLVDRLNYGMSGKDLFGKWSQSRLDDVQSQIKAIDDLIARRRLLASIKPEDVIMPPKGYIELPTLTVTADAAKAKADYQAELQAARERTAALNDLQGAIERVGEAATNTGNPALDAYAEALRNVAAAGAKAIATGADTAQVQADVARGVDLATQAYQHQLAAQAMLADDKLTEILNRQAAQLGGPSVQAAMDYAAALLEIQKVEEQLAAGGKLTTEEAQKIAVARENALKKYQQDLQKAGNENSEFWRRSAEGIQQALADGLFDFSKKGLKGLEQNFKGTLNRILAEIVAADLGKRLFGDIDKTGQLGGWLGSLFSAFGGGHADGGGVLPGRFYQVNERGPELLTMNGRTYLMAGGQSGAVQPIAGAMGSDSGSRPPVTNVYVYNNTSEKTETQQGTESNGIDKYIKVIIGKAAEDVATGGQLGQTIAGAFGLSRRAGQQRI
ncbi:MAG: phage tail length tape measure family protein [Mizugakiibacter sp.]|uniref:phage tail length tape measure family protein n=1 Tax=Mizugakiibacter sp. TaxID=1972610 RepID=UPI00320F00F6